MVGVNPFPHSTNQGISSSSFEEKTLRKGKRGINAFPI